MSQPDFNDFADDILVCCADAQTGDLVVTCDVGAMCRAKYAECPPTWLGMIVDHLVNKGYGKARYDGERPGAKMFKINAAGISRAAEIRKQVASPKVETPTFQNNVTVNPVFHVTAPATNDEQATSSTRAAWFGGWAALLSALAAVAAIFVSLYLAGKQ